MVPWISWAATTELALPDVHIASTGNNSTTRRAGGPLTQRTLSPRPHDFSRVSTALAVAVSLAVLGILSSPPSYLCIVRSALINTMALLPSGHRRRWAVPADERSRGLADTGSAGLHRGGERASCLASCQSGSGWSWYLPWARPTGATNEGKREGTFGRILIFDLCGGMSCNLDENWRQ
jgi:hypothetical protein